MKIETFQLLIKVIEKAHEQGLISESSEDFMKRVLFNYYALGLIKNHSTFFFRALDKKAMEDLPTEFKDLDRQRAKNRNYPMRALEDFEVFNELSDDFYYDPMKMEASITNFVDTGLTFRGKPIFPRAKQEIFHLTEYGLKKNKSFDLKEKTISLN